MVLVEPDYCLEEAIVSDFPKPLIVVGIPAFNEEKMIARIVIKSQKYADIVIVCDDGSNDLTADVAERLGAVVVRHENNLGKGRALRSIFERSKEFSPDIIVTIDADGQHNPDEIPQLIKPLISGQSDVVLGSRYELSSDHKIPEYRRFGLSIIDWLNRKASKSTIKDSQNGFRAYTSKALRAVSSFESNGFSVESEQIMLATKDGLRILEVPITTKYEGVERPSKKSPLLHGMCLVGYFLKIMVEDRPLMFLGVPGLVSILVGLGFGSWMLQIYTVQNIIVTNIALASLGFFAIGFLCSIASIMLYSISRLSKKLTIEHQSNNNE